MQQEIWFQKYRIIRLLGKGGTAKVYLAEHIKLNSFRAIKCISKNHPQYKSQLKEAQILKNLKHSCIPIIYDIEEDENGSYIVEQYLEGDTLKSYVTARGCLDSDIIIHFALQLCDLIHYLHHIDRPILYLDLKPDNIIVTGNNLKLVDFGSAIYLDEAETGKQEYLGTYGYAAPEMYHRTGIDERCDVYGIGMLLYYMATGRSLREDKKSIDHIDSCNTCTQKLKKTINRCLKLNPSGRYASVAQLSKVLSAGRRRLPALSESGPSLRIAVAGAQPRIGVTHLAFRLCRYFMQQSAACIYRECNQNGVVRSIRNRYEGLNTDGNLCRLWGIPMLLPGMEELCEGHVVIEDHGCLTKDNLIDYLEAELLLLVLGGKDWELERSEQVLRMVEEHKGIVYLFNYLDGDHYQQLIKCMDKRTCFRIPYTPDPYAKQVTGAELEFLEELTEICFMRTRK